MTQIKQNYVYEEDPPALRLYFFVLSAAVVLGTHASLPGTAGDCWGVLGSARDAGYASWHRVGWGLLGTAGDVLGTGRIPCWVPLCLHVCYRPGLSEAERRGV